MLFALLQLSSSIEIITLGAEMNIFLRLKHFFVISFIAFIVSSCGTMTVLEIPESEVPEGLWEGDSEIYVSNFQINDPTVSRVRKSGDCSGTRVLSRPYGTPAQNAYCAETRTYDPSRQCNIVTSTFGEGYCPIDYSYQSDVNARSMQKMDSIVSAGTAAQNAVLAWGQNMTLQAQKRALEIPQKYTLSSIMGSSVEQENNVEVIETLIIKNNDGHSSTDLIARTREGYYSECIMPHFSFNGKVSTSYLRIQEERLACELKKDKKGFTPMYINMTTDSKPKTSYIGNLTVKETKDTYEICMLNPIMGPCTYKKPGLLIPDDFEFLRGFVEEINPVRASLTLGEIQENSITVKLIINNEDGIGSLETINLLFDDSYHDVGGLKIRINSIENNLAKLSIEGEFNL
tara:strand:+ start:248 stop:1456 length:1209 start_codon:yes stop_codon:yes gene_type:complete